ncbi:MAG: amino acid adenylation domain-containing protein [Planctomycetota bacterium]
MPTIVDVVQWRAARQPDEVAFTFLGEGRRDRDPTRGEELTYSGLDRRARAVAGELLGRGGAGSRALVVLEPGLDYIAALLGCLYAGVAPAPVYPPDPFRIARTLPRLQAIFRSAECEFLLSSADVLGGPNGALRKTCPGGAIEVESLFEGGLSKDTPAVAWAVEPAAAAPDQLTLLQYTSGTTGEPRGVPITHANLIENLRGMERLLDVDDAVAVQWLPPYHDLGLIGGVFLPLFAGRHMVLMSPLSFMQNPAGWLQAISRYGATSSAAPNFGYELCLRKVKEADCEGLDLSRWQIAVSGAEPVRADTLDRFAERFAPYGFRREAFVPAYGMAETTLMVSIAAIGEPPRVVEVDADALARKEVREVEGGRRVVGCGRPGPGVELQVVDPETRLPTTGVGEVWVRGASVASGYWRSPEATAQHFGQAINGAGGAGFLRTGDLAFQRGGELFFVGRRKEMLILAGRNFYPQDLELAVQAADPAFKTDGGAAVAIDAALDVDDAAAVGGEGLALFQEVQRPKKQDLAALLTTARRVAAEETGIEPARVVLLPVGELPKTSSGKTRRAECWRHYTAGTLSPVAEWPAPASTSEPAPVFKAPVTPTEAWLAECWRRVLGVDEVGRDDNFFALGGRSLQVTQMLTIVSEETSAEGAAGEPPSTAQAGLVLPLKTLFDHPTLAALAAEVDRQSGAAAEQPAEGNRRPGVERTRVDLASPQPLTASQKRFWMVDQLGVDGGANIPVALRLEGDVDADRLNHALTQLVQRHAALRLGFTGDGVGVTQQLAACDGPGIDRWSAAAGGSGAGDKQPGASSLDRLFANKWFWRPFDLSRPPLLRAALVDLGDGAKALALAVHHLVCDGGSIGLLLDDLSRLYAGDELPAAVGFGDATRALQHDGQNDAAYWRERLRDAPAGLALPLAPAEGPPAKADLLTTPRPIASGDLASVERLARRLNATPFLVYAAVLQQVLSRYTGQRRIGLGTAVAGRRSGMSQHAVGCFINTVPLLGDSAWGDRAAGDGAAGDGAAGGANADALATFEQVLTKLRDDALADLDHAATPWEQIVDAAGKPREPGRMPLVQAFLIHDDRPPAPPLGEAKVVDAATDYRGLGVFDLTLVVESSRPEPRLKLVHDGRRFPAPLAERMLASFHEVLQRVCRAPATPIDALPIPARDEASLLRAGGEPAARAGNEPPTHVAAMFARQAQRSPRAVAVECGGSRRTFAELDKAAAQIAGALAERGIGIGDRVGLLVGRSVHLPALILGVWRAGAAYVPLDPEYPTKRLEFMAGDARLACVVTDEAAPDVPTALSRRRAPLNELLAGPAAEPLGASSLGRQPGGDRLAYLMYTSGSTGKPKGVGVPHRAVANLLSSFAGETPLAAGDAMLGSTTISFDISVLELFLPLVTGATLVLADSETSSDASRLSRLLAERRVSHVQGAPSKLRMLLAAGWRPEAGQTVLCGGEEVTPDLAAQLTATGAQVWNVYGPTETTIWSTCCRLPREPGAAAVPIGRPIAGTRCYVLDKRGGLAPIGAWGELAIAGAGLADGYWNRPELTAKKFPADPFADSFDRLGGRMYLTGDTARWAPAANGGALVLEFGGRRDGQVKVRGRRVELREIEIALNAHGSVQESAVIATEANGHGSALVAFVAAAHGAPWTPAGLREHLAGRLPSYMAPSAFVEIDRLPRTDNGKIDRGRLPRDAAAARSAPVIEPRTPLEAKLATWVRDLLRVDRVGVYDNFFELGGQSLLATQLLVRMRDELGLEPPLREVYEQPTVAAWAELLLRCELEAGDCVDAALLDRLEEMTDAEAEAYLRRLDETQPEAESPISVDRPGSES